jgi:DNA polymerase-4
MGIYLCKPGWKQAFLEPLPASKIPGVGEQTFIMLKEMGIRTIGDICKKSAEELEERLGKWGADLWNKAHGLHFSEVHPYHEAKSISTENTFEENKSEIAFLLSELVRMTEKVAYELRQDEKLTGCIAVKIRYPDFETTSKQTSIGNTFRDDELIPVAIDLFHKLYRKGKPVRLLGVRLSELTNHAVQGACLMTMKKRITLQSD